MLSDTKEHMPLCLSQYIFLFCCCVIPNKLAGIFLFLRSFEKCCLIFRFSKASM